MIKWCSSLVCKHIHTSACGYLYTLLKELGNHFETIAVWSFVNIIEEGTIKNKL
jgi:hypothetical protein